MRPNTPPHNHRIRWGMLPSPVSPLYACIFLAAPSPEAVPHRNPESRSTPAFPWRSPREQPALTGGRSRAVGRGKLESEAELAVRPGPAKTERWAGSLPSI